MKHKALILFLCGLAFGGAVLAQQSATDLRDDTYRLIAAAEQRLEDQPALALLYIDSALVRSFEKVDRKAEAYCYLTLGKIQLRLTHYPLALDHLDQATKLFGLTNDAEGRYLAQKEEAKVLSRLKRWPQAKDAWLAFKAKAQAQRRWQDLAEAENQLGQIAVAQDAFADALPHFQNVLSLNKSNNEPDGVISAFNTLSMTCNTMGDTLMANLYSLQAGQFALENGYFNTELPAENTENLNYQWTDESASSYKAALKPSSTKLRKFNLEATEGLARSYESTGLLDSALQNFKTARNIEKGMLEDRITTLEAALAENKELNAQLDRVNWRIGTRQEELRRQKFISLFLGLILLVLLGSGFVVLRSYRSRQRAHQRLALKSLRSQMNPHFIFNSLNSVNSYIAKNDPRAANKYLSEFARLMRGVLENSEQEFIPLQTEVQILELYLGLEHLRFQDRFEYEFTVSPDLDRDSILIPPMLVQPYIENAVWHGLRYKKEKGKLSVSIFPQEEALIIEICDNGIGRKRSAELKTHNQNQQRSTGLKNTAARLDLINTLYNQQLKINIADLDSKATDVGTRVEIKLMLSENSLT
ncbi:MAG: histidine kinase [Bacteroidota bacterium]